MTRLATCLIAGTALLTLQTHLACAQAPSNPPPDQGSQILNGQVDLHSTNAHLNTNIENVGGDVGGQAVAGGNVLNTTTLHNTNATNNQYVSSVNISSGINANVTNVKGSTSLLSQSVCNSADISTDPTSTTVYSNQECDAKDPSSYVNANLHNIGGDASLASTAIGNTFSQDTNAPNAPVQNYQINKSNINSTANANIGNVMGSVSVSATSIGNNAQIVHY